MATTAAAAAAAVPDAIPAAAAAAVPDAIPAAAAAAVPDPIPAAAAAAVPDAIPIAAAATVPDAIPAAATAAVPDATPVPPSTQPHPVPDKCTNYKSHLQGWTQRNNQGLPAYYTESKRDHHRLEFRSTVKVGGERFQSARNHSRRKDAEQDAARVAYEILVTKTINDDDHADVLGLIDQGVVFCKSILHEFSVKTKADQPTYFTDHLEGAPITLFVSSVLFAGNTYTGEAAVSKKDAEQKAAHVAVKSILATKNTCMHQIVRSKEQLIIAITSSGFNKGGVVSQENCNAPTNAITTVVTKEIVHAGEAAGLTADQGATIIPEDDACPQDVSGSEKRKKQRKV